MKLLKYVLMLLGLILTFVSVFALLSIPVLSVACNVDYLKVTIKTDKPQYRWLSDKIDITLTLTNTGNKSEIISFPSTQMFDFVMMNKKTSKIVYIWSHDKVFEIITSNFTLAPGQSMNWQFEWNKHQNMKKFPILFPVFPGVYQIDGGFIATPINTNWAMTNITIGPVVTPSN